MRSMFSSTLGMTIFTLLVFGRAHAVEGGAKWRDLASEHVGTQHEFRFDGRYGVYIKSDARRVTILELSQGAGAQRERHRYTYDRSATCGATLSSWSHVIGIDGGAAAEVASRQLNFGERRLRSGVDKDMMPTVVQVGLLKVEMTLEVSQLSGEELVFLPGHYPTILEAITQRHHLSVTRDNLMTLSQAELTVFVEAVRSQAIPDFTSAALLSSASRAGALPGGLEDDSIPVPDEVYSPRAFNRWWEQ